jgi:hypothetical protein
VSASQPSTLDPETVTINGESFQVTTTKKSVYTYDTQGRILTEYNQFAGNKAHYAQAKADSVFYQYSHLSVNIRTIKFTENEKLETTYEVKLNNQGLSEKTYWGAHATFDKDGYLLALKDPYGIPEQVDNGNVLEWILYLEGPLTEGYRYKNYYDLNKPSLPPVRPFYGRDSRSLITKYTVENAYYPGVPPILYTANYSYAFDSKGHITRQIARGKDGEIGYIFGQNSVDVIDFTYICP